MVRQHCKTSYSAAPPVVHSPPPHTVDGFSSCPCEDIITMPVLDKSHHILRWAVLVFGCVALIGNYYCYVSGPRARNASSHTHTL